MYSREYTPKCALGKFFKSFNKYLMVDLLCGQALLQVFRTYLWTKLMDLDGQVGDIDRNNEHNSKKMEAM